MICFVFSVLICYSHKAWKCVEIRARKSHIDCYRGEWKEREANLNRSKLLYGVKGIIARLYSQTKLIFVSRYLYGS